MLTFDHFSGISNLLPAERIPDNALVEATNVDIGNSGEITRREGFSSISIGSTHSLFESGDKFIAVINNDLKLLDKSGIVVTTLHQSIGASRVWYAALPDGRVAYSNGLISGVVDGEDAYPLGVTAPDSAGEMQQISGKLFPGTYRYAVSYVRERDGFESAPTFGLPEHIEGGVAIVGLQQRDGYRMNVYLTSHDGSEIYLAGSTTGEVFEFSGGNSDLVLPCRSTYCDAPPSGKHLAMWRSRLLVADGATLWASRAGQCETFDLRRDFKQFSHPITAILPVDDGFYVGTTQALIFLEGSDFDKLIYREVGKFGVVPGSAVQTLGEYIKLGDGVGTGSAGILIGGRSLVACFNGGRAVNMTKETYRTTSQEVSAAFRIVRGIHQYIAVDVP